MILAVTCKIVFRQSIIASWVGGLITLVGLPRPRVRELPR
jgi:hypothetical protein